jgi:hypothetical protein
MGRLEASPFLAAEAAFAASISRLRSAPPFFFFGVLPLPWFELMFSSSALRFLSVGSTRGFALLHPTPHPHRFRAPHD